jgi:DNA-binding SARP family transcriptional activator
MEFLILGPLEVLDQGRPIALGGARQRALLALLVIHANETLAIERLIDELWGERPPATAAKTLQVHISRLRKTLGLTRSDRDSGVVVTREPGYELRVDPERIDSRRFERLIAEGRRELLARHPERALSLLGEALSLWRGPPLAEFAYERFAQGEAGRLDELRVGAVEELIEAKLALGRHADAVGELERLIREQPYRERPRAQLMLALYRCDRQADALQAYQDARRTLVEELGIEPGERLRELERAILAQDPALILTGVESVASKPPARAPTIPFVGRERELGELIASLDHACAGRGRLVLLVGAPGIGKSRLAEELIAQAEARGVRVLIGRCWEAGGAPSYWPWTQSLRVLTREVEPDRLRRQLTQDGAELVRLLPELRERLPELAPSTGPLGEGARFRLLASVMALLRGCASTRPLAIVLDDLHAADEPSLLLLRFVVGQLAGSQILIVGCCRDSERGTPLAAALSELTREPATRRIALRGLSATDTARLLEATIGHAPADELAAQVHAETEGNPFFATEIGRLLASADSGWDSNATVPIPETVMEAVAGRLERLSPWCRELLTFASVIGREFDPALVEAVSGASEDQVYSALEEAASARLLAALPSAPGRLRFAHILVRDVLYESIPAPRRVRLHRAIGAALEALYGEHPEPHLAEIARHFLAGGTPVRDKAIEYARRAGDRAASQLAHEEAVRHYNTALDVLDATGPGDADRTCELLLSLGEALSRAGRGQEARDVLRRAATLAEQTGRSDRLARAAVEYGGRFAWSRASTDPFLVPLLERGLEATGETDSAERVRLLARLATAIRDDPLRDRRVRVADEAVQIARRLDDPATLAVALEGQWTAVEGPDTAGGGIEPGAMLVELGEQTGDKERALAGHYYRLNSFWTLANRVGIDVELDAISSLTHELGQPAQRWVLGTHQTMLALMEGRFADAEPLISDTLAHGKRSQGWNAVVSERLALFVLRRAQGRLEEIEDTIKRSVHEYSPLLRFGCALAHVYAELGRKHDASAALDELMTRDLGNEHLDAEWVLSITLLVDPCALVGDQDAAARLYALLAPYERLYTVAPVEATFGSVARALGVLASALERFDRAERHFEYAIETERKMKARPWLAHTQHNLATTLLRRGARGDQERAYALLQDTHDTYQNLGMKSWATRTQHLLDAGRSRPHAPT